MNIIDSQFLLEMYTRGYFPMAKSSEESDVNFFKPHKRWIHLHDFKKIFRHKSIYLLVPKLLIPNGTTIIGV